MKRLISAPRKAYKMIISAQQIYILLRTYNKQLKLFGVNRSRKNIPPQPKKNKVTVSTERKRQQVYQQVVNNIMKKLTKNGPAPLVGLDEKQEG